MTIPQIISLIILVFIAYLSLKKGNDVFSPAKVFLAVWSSCIFLTEFKFSGYQHQWSLYSWFILLIGLFSFLLGLYISYIINAGSKLLSVEEIRNKIKISTDYSKQRLFITISFLFASYFISLILEFIIEGYIPIFHPRADMARMDFGIFGIHLIVSQMPVILFLIVEYFVLGSESRKNTIISVTFFIITFFTYFLILQRFNYVYWLVMSIALLYYATRKINFRNSVISLTVFISFITILTSIRVSQYATQYLYIISKMKYSSEYASFTGPYMYIVMNLENMARAAEKLETHTYSALTFDWLYAFFGLKHWMKDYFNIDPRAFLISSYTTYPFHWYYYYDFGVLGVVFFSLSVGLIIGLIYYFMRIRGTLDSVIYYSICLFFILISFFTNLFTLLNVIVSILLLWTIHRFFILQSPKVKKT